MSLALIGVNLEYFFFTLENIQPFLKILLWRKSEKLLKLEVHCFVIFIKMKYLEFLLFLHQKKFFCFILVPLNIPSQKQKEKQKQKLLQKASQNCPSVKNVFERNEPSTSCHTDTQSADLQNDAQHSSEFIQLEETCNYNYPDNVPKKSV